MQSVRKFQHLSRPQFVSRNSSLVSGSRLKARRTVLRHNPLSTDMRRAVGDRSNGVTTADTAEIDPQPSSPKTPSIEQEQALSMPMLEPSASNNHWVRALAVLAAVAAAAGSSQYLPSKATSFVHVFASSVFVGANIWNTFFVGLTMFKAMPRQMFGRVQSKLFPLYFALTTGANILMLATLGLLRASPAPTSVLTWLAASLAGSLVNWLFIEPKCTGVMFQRYDLENKEIKTEQDQAKIKGLYKQFGKWHGISSMINLVVLCAGFAHLWYLATLIVA